MNWVLRKPETDQRRFDVWAPKFVAELVEPCRLLSPAYHARPEWVLRHADSVLPGEEESLRLSRAVSFEDFESACCKGFLGRRAIPF